MQQKFITSWYLVLFFLTETPVFGRPVGRSILGLLKKVPWVSKRAISYGNMRTPLGFLQPYRAYQARQLDKINKKLVALSRRGVTLESIGRAFVLDNLEQYAVRVSINGGRQLTLRAIAEEDGQCFMFCKRTVNLDKQLARHDYLVLGENFQGQDNLARLLEKSNSFYREIGVNRIELTAGLSMGGSFWPKLGFVPEKSEWKKLRKYVEKNLKSMPEGLAEKFYTMRGVKLSEAVADIFDTNEPLNIDALRALNVGDSKEDKIGIKLLMGSRWKGYLELDNVKRTRMLTDYIEGRKLDVDRKRISNQNSQEKYAATQ